MLLSIIFCFALLSSAWAIMNAWNTFAILINKGNHIPMSLSAGFILDITACILWAIYHYLSK